jgi:hypothetical protein
VFREPDTNGRPLLVEYSGRRFDPPVILDFTEAELLAALTSIGRRSQSLWPDIPATEVGFRLALVHLEESIDPLTHQPTRVYFADDHLMVE